VAINKNFVVRAGLEVATDLLIATDDLRAVGIASTQPTATLGVGGNIAANSGNFLGILTGRDGLRSGVGGTVFYVDGLQTLVGVGTNIPEYLLDVVATGLSTALSLRGGALISGDINATGFATITGKADITGDLYVTGIGTISDFNCDNLFSTGIGTISDFNCDNLFSTGIGTIPTFDSTNVTAVNIDSTNGNFSGILTASSSLDAVDITITGQADITGDLYATGVSTISTLDTTNVTAVSFDATNGNFSGIVTASSGLEAGDTTITGEASITGGLNVGGATTVGFLTGASAVSAVVFYGDGSQLTGIDDGNFQGKTVICENVLATNPGVGTFGNIAINAPAGIISATTGIVTYYGDGSNLINTGSTLSVGSGSQRLVMTTLVSGIMTTAAISSGLTFDNSTNTVTAGIFSGSGTGITGLTNSNLSGSAGITNANLANSTISGVSLGSNLGTLTMGVSGNGLSGSDTYNGSAGSTFTVTSNATNSNTASTIVFRDGSGNFSAGTITANLTGNVTGDVTGNSDTATTATNVNVTANNSTNESTYLVFVDGASGTQGAETDTALRYNPSSNTMTINSGSGTVEANLSGNATTSSSCTGNSATATNATNATNVAITNDSSTSSTRYITFSSATSGNTATRIDTNLTYIPSTNTLSAATFSGNATSATQLQTARQINGVSFNGTANITVEPYVERDDSTNAARYLTFVDSSTAGYQRQNMDTSLTYNPNSNTLTASNFSGTATIATNVTLADESSDTTCFPLFATGATGAQAPKTDSSALTYNASTGTLAATNVNSTSDVNLKTDIHNIEDALTTINQIRGVKFRWRELDIPSVGVIAQEVEEVLPELISVRSDNGTKSVNYNGLVGVLIEAVKELSTRVEHLESQLNNK